MSVAGRSRRRARKINGRSGRCWVERWRPCSHAVPTCGGWLALAYSGLCSRGAVRGAVRRGWVICDGSGLGCRGSKSGRSEPWPGRVAGGRSLAAAAQSLTRTQEDENLEGHAEDAAQGLGLAQDAVRPPAWRGHSRARCLGKEGARSTGLGSGTLGRRRVGMAIHTGAGVGGGGTGKRPRRTAGGFCAVPQGMVCKLAAARHADFGYEVPV